MFPRERKVSADAQRAARCYGESGGVQADVGDPGSEGVGGGRTMRAAAGAKPAGPGGGSVARPPGLLSSLISPRANNLLSLE